MAIDVIIRLLPHKGEDVRMIGHLKIWDDKTGGKKLRNYRYKIAHGGDDWGKKKPEPYKKGRIKNFPRHSSPYALIARCLQHAKEM